MTEISIPVYTLLSIRPAKNCHRDWLVTRIGTINMDQRLIKKMGSRRPNLSEIVLPRAIPIMLQSDGKAFEYERKFAGRA